MTIKEFMKLTLEEMGEYIGMDKILHFCLAGLVTAVFTIAALLQDFAVGAIAIACPLIGAIPVTLFALFKEVAVDGVFDKKDFLASVLGTVPVFIACALGVLFHYLS